MLCKPLQRMGIMILGLLSQTSGLGLYIVKETVAKLNGSILLNSLIRFWTEFTLYLPNYIPTKVNNG